MIPLASKTNINTGNADYPYGKLINDTGVGDGTPVDEQMYNDVHQFLSRLFAQSGLTANNLPDNATNGYQLYEALQAVVAGGMPNVSTGAWVNGASPTVTTDSGTANIASILTNRYKIIGKTFIWEFVGGLTVVSGGPTQIKIVHPTTISQYNFNSALPRVYWGGYKTNIQTRCEMQATTIDIKQFPSATFSGANQPISFTVLLELA